MSDRTNPYPPPPGQQQGQAGVIYPPPLQGDAQNHNPYPPPPQQGYGHHAHAPSAPPLPQQGYAGQAQPAPIPAPQAPAQATRPGTLARLGQVIWGRQQKPEAPPPMQPAYGDTAHPRPVQPQAQPAARPQQAQPAVRDWKMRAVRGMWNFATGTGSSSQPPPQQQHTEAQEHGRHHRRQPRARPEYVWMQRPPRATVTQGDSGYYYSPSLTTMGLQDSVSWCIDLAIEEEKQERIARGDSEDGFGDGGYRKRLDTAMKSELCCLCVGILFFLERLFLGIVCALIMLVGNLFATLLRLPQTFFSFYKNLIFKSPRFGPFLKTMMAIFFFIPGLLSLATVPVISLVLGLAVPFFNHPHNSVVIAAKSVSKYFTKGFEARETCYAHYVIPGTYYEIAILHLLAGLVFLVFGAVIGVLGYLFVAIAMAPRGFVIMSMTMWQDADASDECFFCTVPARILGTCLMFVGTILSIPCAAIYGLFSGMFVGADAGYNQPGKAALKCLHHVKDFYKGIHEWLDAKYNSNGGF